MADLAAALAKQCQFEALRVQEGAQGYELTGRVPNRSGNNQYHNWLLAEYYMLIASADNGVGKFIDISRVDFLDANRKLRYAIRIVVQSPNPDAHGKIMQLLAHAVGQAPMSSTARELTEQPLVGASTLRNGRRSDGKGAAPMGSSEARTGPAFLAMRSRLDVDERQGHAVHGEGATAAPRADCAVA